MRSVWMILILPILAVIFYVNSAGAVPVEEWNMTTLRDMGKINDIEQADDGGYIVATDYSIAKIDPSGHKYWVRELIKPILPTSGHAEISQIVKTGDGGYIFGGSRVFLTNLSISKQICFIIKTDSEGIEEWNRTFIDNINDYYYFDSLRQTQDGGYVLLEGNSQGYLYEVRIIKLDQDGNKTWSREFENGLNPSFQQTSDGGYILVFKRDKPEFRYKETTLQKLDPLGNDIWNRTFLGLENVHIELATDGGFMLSGELRSSITGVDAILIKTDPLGNEIWNKTYGGSMDDGFEVIRRTKDGGFVLAGYRGGDHSTDLYNFYRGDEWLMKVDPQGNKEWEMTFGEFEGITTRSMKQTLDGGYLLSGWSGGPWIVKLSNDSAGKKDNDISSRQENNNEYSMLWIKLYDAASDIYALKQTGDGSIVLAGINSDAKAVLIKTDSSGNEKWNLTAEGIVRNNDISAVLEFEDGRILYSEPGLLRNDVKRNQLWTEKNVNSMIRDKKRTGDGGYIVIASEEGSSRYRDNFIPPTGWIQKTDTSGNEQWKRTFGEYPKKMVTPNSVLQTKDDGYIVIGDYSDWSNYINDAWIIKYDSYGNEKWRRIIRNKSGPTPYRPIDVFPSIVETDDGNYIIGGVTNLYRTTGLDALIIKIDTNGTELWNMSAGGDGNQLIHTMQETSDGGLLFAGSMINLDPEGHMTAMLMKVGKREKNALISDHNASSIETVKKIDGIEQMSMNNTNTSFQDRNNTVQKTSPSSGLLFDALTLMMLFFFKKRLR
jgi:hypothetical protein